MTTQNAGKIYGQGDPSPLTTADLSGFYASDGITATFSRAAGEDVGSYAITTTLVGSSVKLGDYNVANAGATFTISAATPTLTVTDAGGTYTSLVFAATGAVTGAGSVNLGTPAITYYAGTYTTAAQLSGLTALPGAPVDVGAYTVLASYAGSLDYTAASTVATFTISQKGVTVTTWDASKVYGQSDPSPLTIADLSGFYASDGITATFSRAAGEDLGSYAITTTLVDPNGKLGDYTVTNAGATFTISAAAAAVTVTDTGGTYTSQAFRGDGDGDGRRRRPGHAGLHVLFRHVRHRGGPGRGDGIVRCGRWTRGPIRSWPPTPPPRITRRPTRLPR